MTRRSRSERAEIAHAHEEVRMSRSEERSVRAVVILEALGIAIAHVAVIAILMYPVAAAAGYVA